MQRRRLGKTGLELGVLGFGCGNVGGLMIRGTPAAQERAVARALELGINYFDTAPSYGDGESERTLGRVLKTLRPEIVLGTKFRIAPEERGKLAGAIAGSLEASLRRLGREAVDLLQLHNPITEEGGGGTLSIAAVLDEIVPALDTLRRQGKIRFCGITAIGATPALHRIVDAGVFDTAQIVHNLLNPSAGFALPAGFPAQDFARLLDRARAADMGAIGIRVLAGGALSGMETRHALALPALDPIASGPDYRTDVARARILETLVREGHAQSLVEAALRFAASNPAMTTILVGYSSLDHLEYAAASVAKGPLPPVAMERLGALWEDLRDASG
ncbi:MAG: aldo/keto reductase [Alphaproteobacteria bacterium]|nr:aldo/keto reductase [Alphaproteobacteria bacterium]